jgi:hypothetical protein
MLMDDRDGVIKGVNFDLNAQDVIGFCAKWQLHRLVVPAAK